jgi:hypothetical protein
VLVDLEGRNFYVSQGATWVNEPAHPRAKHNGYVHNYILVAEKALGHFLPAKAQVHHFDENRLNDSPGNLVICENQAYHALLHMRVRAKRACGNPNWRKCVLCKAYDDSINMDKSGNSGGFRHRACFNTYQNIVYHKHNPPKESLRGEQVATSKLTEEQVLYIRASSDSNVFLARELNLKSPSTVAAVRRRITWRHIP